MYYCGRGSVLRSWQCITLCRPTSGFVDDVMFRPGMEKRVPSRAYSQWLTRGRTAEVWDDIWCIDLRLPSCHLSGDLWCRSVKIEINYFRTLTFNTYDVNVRENTYFASCFGVCELWDYKATIPWPYRSAVPLKDGKESCPRFYAVLRYTVAKLIWQ